MDRLPVSMPKEADKPCIFSRLKEMKEDNSSIGPCTKVAEARLGRSHQ